MTDELSGWKRSAAQTGIITVGMQIFSTALIGHGLNGLPLDDVMLAKIKRDSIIAIKNMDVVGLKIENEANLLGEVLENLEKVMDATIANGRKLKKT
jgi:hypothetical protein